MIKQKFEGFEVRKVSKIIEATEMPGEKVQLYSYRDEFIKNKIPNTNYTHFSLLHDCGVGLDRNENHYVKHNTIFDRFAEIVILNREHVKDGVLEFAFEGEKVLYVLHFRHMYAPSNPIFDRFEFKITKKNKRKPNLPRVITFKRSLTRRSFYYSKIEEELKGIM